jgi:heme/copper-type cytochrome/quinol oxidase subunit 1
MELSSVGEVWVNNDLYNIIITAHALVMIFFMVMPSGLGGFSNW